LRTALVSHFENCSNNNSSSRDESDINSKNHPDRNNNNDDYGTIHTDSRIVIQNKYFTANVLLEDIEQQQLQAIGNHNKKEDGVILVFDALLSNPDRDATVAGGGTTFDTLASVHQKAEQNGTCGDLLRLCVGVSLGSFSPEELRGKDHEKEYSRRILWCLDNEYEYVEADISQEGQLQGHDLRDKDGFARVVEAIQGTVWSSAVMSESKTKELKETYTDDKSAIQKEVKIPEDDEEKNPYQPPDPSLFRPIEKDDAQTAKEVNNTEGVHGSIEDDVADTAADTSAASLLLDPTQVGAAEMAQLRKDLEAEKLFEKMETVLREASQIREASKSGALTDDERRERAGDAALALVNLMGQFGMEDDDSQAYDSDDDNDSGVVETTTLN
jgi:hypothetical protein